MFTRRLAVLALVVAVSLLAFSAVLASPGSGAIINGVWVENGSVTPADPGPYQAPPFPDATVINFDDVTAPCLFVDTQALREQYAAMGVHFMGSGPLNGGAIVNECGNFGVTGYSAPNFLGFNSGGAYAGGGTPTLPETITFDLPLTFVAAKMGSYDFAGSQATLTAYGADGQVLGTGSVTLAAELQFATISATGIYTVVITSPAGILVVDDLAFSSEPTAVALTGLQARPAMPVAAWPLAAVLASAVVLGAAWVLRRR